MTDQILFSHVEDYRHSLPNYEDFALVSKRIIQKLNEHKPGDWKHIDIGESIMQLDANLLEMMEKNLIAYESLAFIFETKPQGKIISKSQMTLAFNFSTSHSWPEYHLFSTSSESTLRFLNEVNEKLRQLLMQSITYLVDTENGVQRRNYGEQATVNREDVLLSEGIKQDIFRSIDEFFKEDGHFFKDYGLPYKRGILLYGSPGNGKTTLVKSITGSTSRVEGNLSTLR